MPKRSAGLLAYRKKDALEVFLVHPGGPLWANKDAGAWSIPKGEYGPDEEPLTAARREFVEETGFTVEGEFIDLGEIRQAGGKLVHAWAIAADVDSSQIKSNTFVFQGREFPEIDRADWFSLERAREAINKGQLPLLERLEASIVLAEKGQ